MANSRLNKQLWTDIIRLKLLTKPDAPVRFLLDQSPFDGIDDQEETVAAAKSEDIVIIGRVLPKSDIYKEGAYQIEMKLARTYPYDPPVVRFLTPIYHPNIGNDGRFSAQLLLTRVGWRRTTSLVDVVRSVVDCIDNPDIEYSLNYELGREYMENRSVFNRKAMEYVKKHALPRF